MTDDKHDDLKPAPAESAVEAAMRLMRNNPRFKQAEPSGKTFIIGGARRPVASFDAPEKRDVGWFAYLDGLAVRFNDTEAWIHGIYGWRPLDIMEAGAKARLVSQHTFEKMFPGLPELPGS